MKNNVTFSIGNVAVIDKVNEKFGLFDFLFDNLGTKAKEKEDLQKVYRDIQESKENIPSYQ